MVNHSGRKHALLGASSASRWMNCTPSAVLESRVPESTSVYAQEGELAHEISELKLRTWVGEITEKEAAKEMKKLEKNSLFNPEMREYTDLYVGFIQERFNEFEDRDLYIETRLDFSRIVPGGFGTGDTLIVGGGVLDVIDLKYGKGVRVDAQDNSQLKLYALGAIDAFGLIYDIEKIRLTIIQPRLDNYSVFEISPEELETWATEEVRPKALAAAKGKGDQVVGDWCTFCKIKGVCRAMRNFVSEKVSTGIFDPKVLEDSEILDVYKSLPIISAFISSVSEHVVQAAANGKKWEGFKLVEAQTKRTWTNKDDVLNLLSLLGYDEKDYTNQTLKGLTEIEKLVGKTDYVNTFLNFVHKPQGAPTLVADSDPRKSFGATSAARDFDD